MKYEASCPIWETPAASQSLEKSRGSKGPHWVSGLVVDSPRTNGIYIITTPAYRIVGSKDFTNDHRAALTTWLIEQRRVGIETPEINEDVINRIKKGRRLSVHDRASKLLQHISSLNPHIGSEFYFYPTFQSTPDTENQQLLAFSESSTIEEVSYLLGCLEDLGFVAEDGGAADRLQYTITPSGHSHLHEIETTKIDSLQGFVAMWFDDSMIEFYEKGFELGITNAGYKPFRIDRKDHNNKIDDEIISEIRRSRFLVADFTQGKEGARGGVYYEAGFAHGLNIPVIFTCKDTDLKNVHFDTRQYNHIVWKDADDLSTRLAQRISAILGDGPLKK